MMYSDADLHEAIKNGDLTLDPYRAEHISAATVDLTLHRQFRIFHNTSMTHIDVKEEFDVTEQVTSREDGSFVIHPGEFVLGSTAEVVSLSNRVGGILEG